MGGCASAPQPARGADSAAGGQGRCLFGRHADETLEQLRGCDPERHAIAIKRFLDLATGAGQAIDTGWPLPGRLARGAYVTMWRDIGLTVTHLPHPDRREVHVVGVLDSGPVV